MAGETPATATETVALPKTGNRHRDGKGVVKMGLVRLIAGKMFCEMGMMLYSEDYVRRDSTPASRRLKS